jgi:hypothetical protein
MAVLFAALVAVGIARVGAAAAVRSSAQAAADASALAGAADGDAAAEQAATANDATVVRIDHDGSDVCVTVERRGVTATARAQWQPAPIP